MAGDARKAQSSLPLQILLYFGAWYDLAFWIVNILVFVYKGMNLPYPRQNFDIEFSVSFLYAIVEPVRLFLGSKGNKTEQPGPLVFCIILSLPVLAFYVYFILFQTYVLRIDQLLNGVGIGFCGSQVLLSMVAILTFVRASRAS